MNELNDKVHALYGGMITPLATVTNGHVGAYNVVDSDLCLILRAETQFPVPLLTAIVSSAPERRKRIIWIEKTLDVDEARIRNKPRTFLWRYQEGVSRPQLFRISIATACRMPTLLEVTGFDGLRPRFYGRCVELIQYRLNALWEHRFNAPL